MADESESTKKKRVVPIIVPRARELRLRRDGQRVAVIDGTGAAFEVKADSAREAAAFAAEVEFQFRLHPEHDLGRVVRDAALINEAARAHARRRRYGSGFARVPR